MGVTIDPRNIEVIDDAMANVYRDKSGAERLQIVSDMYESARLLVASGIRARHPDWAEQEVARETARRLSRDAF